MEITVKFIDYGNEISVSKIDPCCVSVSDAFRTRSKHVHYSAPYPKQFKIRILNSLYT